MKPLDTKVLVQRAGVLGVTLDSQQQESFEIYFKLLQEWNEKLNLTSVQAEDMLSLHFLDSLSLVCAHTPKGKVLDIGTGAGFPGLPLKIAFPEIELCVLDSIAKKLKFVELVAKEICLPITTICARAEAAAHDIQHREQFDLVVSRAVADFSLLAQWMLPFVRLGGTMIAMKSKDVEQELQNALSEIEKNGGSNPRCITVTIPGTDIMRTLITIEKVTETPQTLPKRGNIKKRK